MSEQINAELRYSEANKVSVRWMLIRTSSSTLPSPMSSGRFCWNPVECWNSTLQCPTYSCRNLVIPVEFWWNPQESTGIPVESCQGTVFLCPFVLCSCDSININNIFFSSLYYITNSQLVVFGSTINQQLYSIIVQCSVLAYTHNMNGNLYQRLCLDHK